MVMRIFQFGDDATVRRVIWRVSGFLVLLAVAMLSVAFYSANSMDRASVDRQRALVDNAISLRLAQSLSELRSVAWWDEMVLKSRADQFDANWLDIEVGVFVTTSYAHDRVLILDEQNQPVYGFWSDTRLSASEMKRFTKAITPLIDQIRGGKNASPRIKDLSLVEEQRESSAITDRSYGKGAAALVSVDGKPVLASIMSITPSMDLSLNAPKPRLLVSLIDLTSTVMTDIGKSVLIPDLAKRRAPRESDAAMLVRSDDGQALGTLSWTPQQEGRVLLGDILPLILCILAGTAFSLWILFRMLVRSNRQLADREREAQELANHDMITGLPNRRSLESELFERSASTTTGRSRLACAVIDLDRFKDINDTLGHHAGDALIRGVAERLRAQLEPGDFIARLGGDEFAVLRECAKLSDLDSLSFAITSLFAHPFSVAGHQIETGASVGISLSGFDRAVDELMREADIALYQAKENARGTTVRFAPAMASAIETRRMLEIDLKAAIAARALTMVYQPIVEASSGTVHSVEALVRWHSPRHGDVSPEVFVGIAEATGLMAELGRFVIERSFEDARRWPHLQTAINISPAQLRSATLVQDLLNASRANEVAPSRISIEITETVLMTNDERTSKTLHILKEHGFSLSLDDFGTGYSSLAYVRDFPFDKLKIDRSFVQGGDSSGKSTEIIKAVVNFGLILGREVIAEGIETEQEMQAMQAAGATHLQGFLFSRPLAAAHIEALVATSGRLTAKRASDAGAAASRTKTDAPAEVPALRRIA